MLCDSQGSQRHNARVERRLLDTAWIGRPAAGSRDPEGVHHEERADHVLNSERVIGAIRELTSSQNGYGYIFRIVIHICQ